MDILQLIDRLEELFNDAKAVPFTLAEPATKLKPGGMMSAIRLTIEAMDASKLSKKEKE